ncbi:hypothetical protein ACQUWL_20385 [Serratia marcescens]|uniref:hypothetical protein n=1 Tax=Serratia marcescens TaxID=615 RepID=UPI003D168D2F
MTKESKPFTVKPEGKVVLENKADGTVAFSSDKPMALNMNNILSVGVQNVVDIKSYQLDHLESSTRHLIEFHGGGSVTLEYSHDGEIIQCSIRELLSEVERGERIMVKRK